MPSPGRAPGWNVSACCSDSRKPGSPGEGAEIDGQIRQRWATRLRLTAEHETWMAMSGLLALCVLAVVALLVLPLFGPRIAAVTAVTLVVGILTLCYFVCVSRSLPHGRRAGPAGGEAPPGRH